MSLVADLNRLFAEVSAAHSKAAVPNILFEHRALVDSLSPRTRDQIMAAIQNLVAELPD